MPLIFSSEVVYNFRQGVWAVSELQVVLQELQKMNQRFDKLESRFDALESRFDTLKQEMEDGFAAVNKNLEVIRQQVAHNSEQAEKVQEHDTDIKLLKKLVSGH